MAAKIFNVLFQVFITLVNVILLPINTAISGLLPSLTDFLNNLTNAVNLFIGNGLAYFLNMLPPYSRGMILIYLLFLVSYYTISFSIHAVVWALNIIKKLPMA